MGIRLDDIGPRPRRSKQQMIDAVKRVNHLMAVDGLPEASARFRFKISKDSYDRYNAMLESVTDTPTPPRKEAWECPRCGRINAPFMPWCDCKREDFR